MGGSNPKRFEAQRKAGAVLALAWLLTTSAGCRDVLGIEQTRLVTTSDGGAAGASCLGIPEVAGSASEPPGTGVGWWSGCDSDESCFSAGLPTSDDRPTDAPVGDDLPTFYLAFTRAQLGSRNAAGEHDANAWQAIGLDIDGLCSDSSTCPSSGDPPLACRPPSSSTEGDGLHCRDNMLGLLDYMLDHNPATRGVYMATDRQFNCSLCQGAYNMVIAISGYNGEANDALVRMDVYASPGLVELKSVECAEDTGEPPADTRNNWDASACWTRSDEWTIRRSHVRDGDALTGAPLDGSYYNHQTAYVRDGYLVAALPPNTPLWFLGEHAVRQVVPLIIQDGLLVGRLSQGPDGWTMTDGVAAGRWRRTDLMEGFERIGLCRDDPIYTLLDGLGETYMDVLWTGEILPEVECNALSVGFSFEAAEASVGPLTDVVEPDLCGGAGAAGSGG